MLSLHGLPGMAHLLAMEYIRLRARYRYRVKVWLNITGNMMVILMI
jgi:hypothetical protein